MSSSGLRTASIESCCQEFVEHNWEKTYQNGEKKSKLWPNVSLCFEEEQVANHNDHQRQQYQQHYRHHLVFKKQFYLVFPNRIFFILITIIITTHHLVTSFKEQLFEEEQLANHKSLERKGSQCHSAEMISQGIIPLLPELD